MTKEEYNAIVGMVELLGYQYCERNKIRLGTDTEFKRGLNEALKVMKNLLHVRFIMLLLRHKTFARHYQKSKINTPVIRQRYLPMSRLSLF